jgi:hypothetical protein
MAICEQETLTLLDDFRKCNQRKLTQRRKGAKKGMTEEEWLAGKKRGLFFASLRLCVSQVGTIEPNAARARMIVKHNSKPPCGNDVHSS